MKLALVITGASGVELGKKFVDFLPKDIEVHIVVSDNALTVGSFENRDVAIYRLANIAASISSGSFQIDATAIIPCSMNTLAKIACGISDNLATRVAAVALKEQKKLLLAPRELPFSSIALENMHKLSSLGVIIAPPVMGYYSENNTLEEMEKFIIGKWYDALDIKHDLYKRWGCD
ncbi:MAG: UbiX family flavin prenyltransferase [Sulfurovum sp.]|nr:UbiX family flavin prenyltransferase [Sulfurovum sp.]